MPMVLFEIAKGIVTGQQPNVSDLRSLDEDEIRRAASVTEPRPTNA
jgi:hypothetical protein